MKKALKILAIVVGILILILVAVPFFVDANSFRPKLESELTAALGREVKVGNLSLSLLSGAVEADQISIADDGAFSKSPFVDAKSLKIGVELIPLIFSKSLHVTEVTLNQPEIGLVRSENGVQWNFSSLANQSKAAPAPEKSPEPAATSPNVSVAKLTISNGRLTISRAGSRETPHIYDKVNIEVTNISLSSAFPFKMSANLPAGGTLQLDGQAGPIDSIDAALTPLQASVSVKQMDLAASGFVDPASGISGIADFDGTVSSDGHDAKTAGTLKASKLKVVQKGSPASRLVEVKYTLTHNLVKQVGTLTQGEVAMGNAVAHLAGTYDAHEKVTSINMKIAGQGMPVDDLEAMLPALGVVLPPKATLKGGTLAIDFSIVGPVDKLVTIGTLHMENSALAGFSIGSKLSALGSIFGKSSESNDTTIQNFSSDVHVSPEGTQVSNLNLTVPSYGVLTGAGTVSPANALEFKMSAKLGSNGPSIPFNVAGTTADPKFTPDMKAMASGLLKGTLGRATAGQNNPVSDITGLFKKKK
ncbi:MAG TPA: AsmA family protein [Candidatus Sulfotelmatobacter sp.]|nr:AsmA family protein [Candidatus Sulfotelmatobacter sp.]